MSPAAEATAAKATFIAQAIKDAAIFLEIAIPEMAPEMSTNTAKITLNVLLIAAMIPGTTAGAPLSLLSV